MKRERINVAIFMLNVLVVILLTSRVAGQTATEERATREEATKQTERTGYIYAVIVDENGKQKTISKTLAYNVSPSQEEKQNEPEIPGWVRELAAKVSNREASLCYPDRSRPEKEDKIEVKYAVASPFEPSRPGSLCVIMVIIRPKRPSEVEELRERIARHIAVSRAGRSRHCCICNSNLPQSVKEAHIIERESFPYRLSQAVFRAGPGRYSPPGPELSNVPIVPTDIRLPPLPRGVRWRVISKTEHSEFKKLRQKWLESHPMQLLEMERARLVKECESRKKAIESIKESEDKGGAGRVPGSYYSELNSGLLKKAEEELAYIMSRIEELKGQKESPQEKPGPEGAKPK